MSAFAESPERIATVAAFAADTRGDAAPLAEILALQNLLSVCHIYSDIDPDDAAGMAGDYNADTYVEKARSEAVFTFMRGTEKLDPATVHRFASSVEYQSCETPGYEHTKAARTVRAVIRRTADAAPARR